MATGRNKLTYLIYSFIVLVRKVFFFRGISQNVKLSCLLRGLINLSQTPSEQTKGNSGKEKLPNSAMEEDSSRETYLFLADNVNHATFLSGSLGILVVKQYTVGY